MFPSDNGQQDTSNNTTFSGSSLGAPAPAVTDPYAAPASSPPAPADQPATAPSSPAPATDAPAPAVEPGTEDHTAALNDFLSDDNDPSFLGDTPAAATSAPQVQDTPAPASVDGDHDLASMKQQALTQLQPLVDHLDQSAEEQFKTTMMMIQATDDHRLLKKAFESAQKITDDKVRAQALLDIINEINYFTTNQAQ